MRLTLSNINLIVINLCFIWIGVQATIANGVDGQQRLLTLLFTIMFIANLLANHTFRRQFSNIKSPIFIWFIWFVYATVNTIWQFTSTPEVSTILFITVELFLPLALLTTIAAFRPEKIFVLVKSLQSSLYVFFLFIFIFSGFDDGRLSIERFDPNEYSMYAYALISIICINYFLNLQSFKTSFALLIPVMIFAVLLNSRTGFAGSLFLILGFLLVTKVSLFSLQRVIIIAPFVLLLLSYIFGETELGERLLSTTSQSELLETNPAKGTIFEYYGDRGAYYFLGFQAFLDAPIFGIGLKNFQNYYYTVLHSEVMIHLSELGFIGFVLYITFLYKIIKNLIRQKNRLKTVSPIYKYFIYIIIAILFASTNLFLYKSYAIALLYGLIILFSRDDVVNFIKQKTNNLR
jgi:hypothetical protein